MKKHIVEDMEEFFEHATTASIQEMMGGVDGIKHFEIGSFPAKFKKYILLYVKTNKTVCECLAMYLSDNGYLRD